MLGLVVANKLLSSVVSCHYLRKYLVVDGWSESEWEQVGSMIFLGLIGLTGKIGTDVTIQSKNYPQRPVYYDETGHCGNGYGRGSDCRCYKPVAQKTQVGIWIQSG